MPESKFYIAAILFHQSLSCFISPAGLHLGFTVRSQLTDFWSRDPILAPGSGGFENDCITLASPLLLPVSACAQPPILRLAKQGRGVPNSND